MSSIVWHLKAKNLSSESSGVKKKKIGGSTKDVMFLSSIVNINRIIKNDHFI